MHPNLDYELLAKQARALLEDTDRLITKAANFSALLYQEVPGLNWAGFYFLDGDTLWLGPFQGKPACTSIPVGSGVCGTAVETGEVQRVANVHDFEGHIACDGDSRSELVVPLRREGEIFGVLDLDSPVTDRFSARDQAEITRLAGIFEQAAAGSL